MLLLSIILSITGILLCSAISFSSLEQDFRQLQRLKAKAQPNVFGIRLNSTSSPLIHERMKIVKDKKAYTSNFTNAPISSHRLQQNIHKILVYESNVMPKFEVKILQIRKIKRIGGGYPYGPRNNSILQLKEPIFVVNRYTWNAETGSYQHPLENIKDIKTTKWQSNNETIEFPVLPYKLLGASLECQYCFVYWKRQKKFQPESIYLNCCSSI